MTAEVRDPPQRDVLSVVGKPDSGGKEPSRGFERLNLARLKREVEKCQGTADRRIENCRQYFVDVSISALQGRRDLLIAVSPIIQPVANEAAKLIEIAQYQVSDRYFPG